jgi:hypothetical protein
LLTLIRVGQTADRLSSPHASLGQVQLDFATKLCVLCVPVVGIREILDEWLGL